jgi:hypothetical protein
MGKRKRIDLYIDEDVIEAYKKEIAPTGQSVSRVLETVMRISTSKNADKIMNIFDTMFEAVKKHEKKKKG